MFTEQEDLEVVKPLRFSTSKLVTIMTQFQNQSHPTVALIEHAIRIVEANTELVSAGDLAVAELLSEALLRKAVLDEVIVSFNLSERLVACLRTIASTPEFLLPPRFYLYLLEEFDLGTHLDHAGLNVLLTFTAIAPGLLDHTALAATWDVPMTTMVFSLLELWPASLPLGSNLFKIMCAQDRSHLVPLAVNIFIRVLAGRAKGAVEVDMRHASRFLGNLLNASETVTRTALTCEVAHLCAIETPLPGQLHRFLSYITNLTSKKERNDKRLNMMGMLTRILRNHCLAFATTPKAAIPSISLILSLMPFPLAATTAKEVVLESSNSHMRVALLSALFGVWEGSVSAQKTTEPEAPSADTNDASFWNLLVMLAEADRVVKVRLGAIQHMQRAGQHLLGLSAQQQGTIPTTTAVTEAPQASFLSFLPPPVIVVLCQKCADTSLPVQALALELLWVDEPAYDDNDSGSVAKRCIKDCPALLAELNHASIDPCAMRNIYLVLFSISEIVATNPEWFHPSVVEKIPLLLPWLEMPKEAAAAL